MAYLELSPMVAALRERPEDFDFEHGWLTHFPSRHRFQFDQEGNVRLRANCSCASLAIRPEQGLELWSAFQVWRANYWRAIVINREFAGHFRQPNFAQRIFRRIVAKLRVILLDPTLTEPENTAIELSVAQSNRSVITKG